MRYALDFIFLGQFFRFLFIKLRTLVALAVIMSIWRFHLRSEEMVSHKYLVFDVVTRASPFIV